MCKKNQVFITEDPENWPVSFIFSYPTKQKEEMYGLAALASKVSHEREEVWKKQLI